MQESDAGKSRRSWTPYEAEKWHRSWTPYDAGKWHRSWTPYVDWVGEMGEKDREGRAEKSWGRKVLRLQRQQSHNIQRPTLNIHLPSFPALYGVQLLRLHTAVFSFRIQCSMFNVQCSSVFFSCIVWSINFCDCYQIYTAVFSFCIQRSMLISCIVWSINSCECYQLHTAVFSFCIQRSMLIFLFFLHRMESNHCPSFLASYGVQLLQLLLPRLVPAGTTLSQQIQPFILAPAFFLAFFLFCYIWV